MTLTMNPLPANSGSKKLCCYSNSTDKMQVVRITNIKNWYLERVVFPREYFLFEAPAEAELEVYQGDSEGVKLLAKHSCYSLQVEEGNYQSPVNSASPRCNTCHQ
ncbi:DUF1830 domain-containing protein [Capilliphycus salinus ALCB114379]|uniref:DUF1830 domain-containing protein n=1 Tax=Capilliphycus salinus TaxID=2768948 RepID=UPI0039A7768B